MNQKNFDELLEKIRNNSYTEQKLVIGTIDSNGEIYMDSFDFNDQACKDLAAAVRQNTFIKELDLSSNAFGDDGLRALATLTNIKDLNVSNNPFTIRGVAELFKGSFEVLNISCSNLFCNIEISDAEITEIFTSISKTIKQLTLESCDLYAEQMNSVIASLIKTNQTLTYLNLTSNKLSDQALSTLENNFSLKTLIFRNNQLTDASAKYIGKNISLKEINIANNKFTDNSSTELAENFSLENLDISDNKLTAKGLEILINRNFQDFFISDNSISFEEFLSLSSYHRELQSQEQLIVGESTMVDG